MIDCLPCAVQVELSEGVEIGTGRGYQAAVLAELADRVYSVELIDELGQRAGQLLKRQGYTNIEVRVANGYFGWPEHAPFDKVMVTAAPDLIPAPLINQLKAGGRMVIPVGLPDAQQLVLVEKDINGRVTAATRLAFPAPCGFQAVGGIGIGNCSPMRLLGRGAMSIREQFCLRRRAVNRSVLVAKAAPLDR